MPDPHDEFLSQQVDAAVAEYLEAVEEGRPVDTEAFLARHTNIASELQEFLANYRSVNRVIPGRRSDASTKASVRSTDGSRAVAAPLFPLPHSFGDFDLLEEIARGGMGVVYKARQKNPDRIVALKMILAGQLASQSDVDRFVAEAHAAASLDHPNIVQIFEVGQRDGQHYFTMSYVAGESLAQRLLQSPLAAREAAGITADVARAVEYAHRRAIVHRDLKPANILLDADSRARVTDFGLAKRQTDHSGLTCSGQLLGTPSFMSPEQVTGDPKMIGPASDVYSLGATLYALVTGRPPFHAARTLDTLKQVMDQDPVSPREFDATIPRDLETIVLKALAKEPASRYHTAKEMADDLQRFLADRPILARRSTSRERFFRWCRRNRIVASLLAAVAGLLIASVTILAVSNVQIRQEAEEKAAALSERNQALAAAQNQELLASHRFYAAQMNLAMSAWKSGDAPRTVSLLETLRPTSGHPDLRGIEWHYLHRLSDPGLLRRWRAHEAIIFAMALSPDGAVLATCGTGRSVRLWDAASGEQSGELCSGEYVTRMAFSPDGKFLATIVPDWEPTWRLVVWDVATRHIVWHNDSHPTAVAFTPDGRILATATRTDTGDETVGQIELWQVADGQPLSTWTGHKAGPGSLVFSPDGKSLASAMPPFYPDQASIILWDLDGFVATKRWEVIGVGAIGFSISDDGQTLYAGNREGIQPIDVASGRLDRTLVGHAECVSGICPLPGGRQLVTAAGDRTVRLWDIAARSSKVVGTELASVSGLAVNKSKRFVASGDEEGWVSVRSLDTVQPPTFRGSRSVEDVRFTSDGQSLIVAGSPICVLDSLTLEARSTGPDGAVAISTDGQMAALRDVEENKLAVWRIDSQDRGPSLKTGPAVRFRFSTDGKQLAAWQPWQSTLQLWDTTSGVGEDIGLGNVLDVAYSPTTHHFSAGLQFREIAVFDLDHRTWKLHNIGRAHECATAVRYSQQGDRLAAGLESGEILLFDVEPSSAELKLQSRWKGHTLGVVAVAFSREGRELVSAGKDQSVRFWDVATGQERVTLDLSAKLLTFSPDGRRLAVVGTDDTVQMMVGGEPSPSESHKSAVTR